jgi:hypothetical protein
MCAVVLLATGCGSGPAEIDAPHLSAADAQACKDFVADLPATVSGEKSHEISGDTEYGAAWGDPAIVLTCGVDEPTDFTDTSTCVQADGVGWFVPDAVLLADDDSLDVTMTAVGYRPRVQVFLPGEYRPEGFAAAAAEIGDVVGRDLEKVESCK